MEEINIKTYNFYTTFYTIYKSKIKFKGIKQLLADEMLQVDEKTKRFYETC